MLSEIFLPISFFLLLGLIGNTELGGSMLNMLWSIPNRDIERNYFIYRIRERRRLKANGIPVYKRGRLLGSIL